MWTIWKRLTASWALRPAVGAPPTPAPTRDLSDKTTAAVMTLSWLKAYIEALERGRSEAEAYDAMMAAITERTGPAQRADSSPQPVAGTMPLSKAWELWSTLPTFGEKRRVMAEILESMVKNGDGDAAKMLEAANAPVFTSFAAVELLLGDRSPQQRGDPHG